MRNDEGHAPREQDRQDYFRLVDHDADGLDDDGAEPLAPEVIASLIQLRERLKEKLFAPNPATRTQWSSLRPSN